MVIRGRVNSLPPKNLKRKIKTMTKQECKKYMEKYYKLNKNKLLKRQREYYLTHKDKIAKYHLKYRKLNKNKIAKTNKEWYNKNKKRIIEQKLIYLNKRKNIDVPFRILCNLRARLYLFLKGINKSDSTLKLLGCSLKILKRHLEKKFQSGMTWQNYGKWHIDHIRPCASFDLSKPEEQKKCFNYKNLQPLWAKDNLKKYKNDNSYKLS